MTSPLRRRALLAAPLLIAPLLLAGCSLLPSKSTSTGGSGSTSQSGSGSPSGSGSQSGSGSAAEASAKAIASAISSALHSGQPAAQTGPVKTGDQLCALVSPADAAAALGATVTDSGGDSYLNDEPLCGYSGGPHSGSLNLPVTGVTVVWGPVSDDPYDTSAMFGDGTPVAVSGVGQKAAVKDGGFEALIGDHTLQLLSVGTTTPSHDQLVAFAKLFAAKLT